MNKLEKLLDEILTDIGCDCNIKLELIDAFDTETREYYDVLNNRVQNGETIAKVELDILRKKFMTVFQTVKSYSMPSLRMVYLIQLYQDIHLIMQT